VRVAIVGGSGVDVSGLLENPAPREVDTAYGGALVEVGGYAGREVVFLRRHGREHTVPPHRVNYRANIAALDDLGCDRLLATAAVGSIDPQLRMGEFVVIDQFLDFTSGRASTFHDGDDAGVVHVDVTAPYCDEIRGVALDEAAERDIVAHDGGTYVCTQGPRFESAAEIRMYQQLGGSVVGMTGVPEVVLAREVGLHYATICAVTNLAAGLRPDPVSHEEVIEAQEQNAHNLSDLLTATLTALPEDPGCDCAPAPHPVGE
jgi:5'-methylthioadenosine phosphorylase